jgi:FkbM family methyltransferase
VIVRKFLRAVGNAAVNYFLCLPGSGRFVDRLVNARMHRTITATHNGQTMRFVDANHLCRYRANSFSTKEPDTLEWIDAIPEGSVLWDIGANVGLYSIYAAKYRKCRVFAFEPSVFNLEMLARNIHVNQLQALITIVPLALSDQLGASLLRMTSTDWGGALSSFGKDVDQNGQKMQSVFEYRTVGLTMGAAINYLGIPNPRFIKLDVDGIEHFVLQGGCDVLKSVDSVLVEINDYFYDQAERSSELLAVAGLTLYRKRHMVDGQYNQWWRRTL